MEKKYIIGDVTAGEQLIPAISTELKFRDLLGTFMVRWGFNRDNYKVDPGIYALGSPNGDSDVFVTANYKLTFDQVRKNLSGLNCWLLVLDTKGVNVWCSAGKGTFSSKELVSRIHSTSLGKIINHRRLILPQLSATGVAAHKVRQESGFNVHYGPVRISDIRKFISSGYRADREMRKVKFSFHDRVRLIPNDFMYGKYQLLGAMLVLFLLSGISNSGLSYRNFSGEGGPAVLKVFLSYAAGIILMPVLLPYLPGRHFSLKGFFSGMIVFLCFVIFGHQRNNYFELTSWFFITGAISSYTAMNFTGSSTYTSLSGVRKEMKLFVPLQIVFIAAGVILNVIGKLK